MEVNSMLTSIYFLSELNSKCRLSVIVYDAMVVWKEERKIYRASSVRRSFLAAAHNPLCVLSKWGRPGGVAVGDTVPGSAKCTQVSFRDGSFALKWSGHLRGQQSCKTRLATSRVDDRVCLYCFTWLVAGGKFRLRPFMGKWNRQNGNKEHYISLLHKACMTGPTWHQDGRVKSKYINNI